MLLINGHRIKFDLPQGETLMWADGLISIFAVADLVTPDRKSQWFSKFMLHAYGTKVAAVERREIMSSQKMNFVHSQTLSLVLFDKGVGTPARLGSYDMADGAYRFTLKRSTAYIVKINYKDIAQNNFRQRTFFCQREY